MFAKMSQPRHVILVSVSIVSELVGRLPTGSYRCPTATSKLAAALSAFASWTSIASRPLSSLIILYSRSSCADLRTGLVKTWYGGAAALGTRRHSKESGAGSMAPGMVAKRRGDASGPARRWTWWWERSWGKRLSVAGRRLPGQSRNIQDLI